MFVIKFLFFFVYIKLRKKLNSSSKVTDLNPTEQTDITKFKSNIRKIGKITNGHVYINGTAYT